jgi:ADP-ribose pyrophosphatase
MKRIFKGRLIDLYAGRKRLPGGYVAGLEVVKHPGAVLIVPFLDEDAIILLRQFRPVISSYIWELPAGTLRSNEPPLRCAKRELIEETGYRGARWERLGYLYPVPGYSTEKIHLFAARDLTAAEARRDADELLSPRVLARREIIRLLERRKIVDAKTIAALALAGVLSPR